MPEELLVIHCSPTLAGLKTASLFAYTFADDREMRSCVRCWNRRLTGKGLRILPLCFENGRALIYVYRPARLSRDLRHGTACRLLRERGYPAGGTSERCIIRLMKRMREQDEFPHEIGLFLGYPPEDVRGFIENGARGCKCVGCWKVYGDAETARETFAKYKKCTDVYRARYAEGRSVERLTVAG